MSDRAELIPVITDKADCLADVIFVHGINGDPKKTWMTDNNIAGYPEKCWLYWLGKDVPNIAVWTLGYPASASARTGFTMSLNDRADSITNLLLNHPGLKNSRPIIFVAHSMGGLLVKNILRRSISKDISNAESFAQRIKGIVFLSTPHQGSNLANFIDHLAFLLKTTVSVRELRKDEPSIIELNKWFLRNFGILNLQAQVFCETRESPVIKFLFEFKKIVVDKESAGLHTAGINVIPLDANHSSICWIKDFQFRKEDQLYSNIRKFIDECLERCSLSKQMENWKILHEQFHRLNTQILYLRGVIVPGYQINSLLEDWAGSDKCQQLIIKYTDLSQIVIKVRREFEEQNLQSKWFDQLNKQMEEIDKIVDERINPEDVEARIKSLQNYVITLLKINNEILGFLDDKLKSTIRRLN